MKNTVYILGAGFSATAGIPTMARFIGVAKDIAIEKDDKKLLEVIRKIRDLSNIKNYCSSDLTNLEEVFSILEMEDWVLDTKNADLMKHMIRTVLDETTPKIIDKYPLPGNWYDWFMGGEIYSLIFGFVAYLMNLKFRKESETISNGGTLILHKEIQNENKKNDIISLNYDSLLENVVDQFNKYAKEGNEIEFNNSSNGVGLYKLHGCIKKDTIIPPTWAKAKNNEVEQEWKSAYKRLIDANSIEILGYSLPDSDSYFKYFIKSAINNAQNLKRIRVICLDPYEDVKKRYKDLICFKDFEFVNSNISSFLNNFANFEDDRHGWKSNLNKKI